MTRHRFIGWLSAAALLATVQLGLATAFEILSTAPAQAQFRDDRNSPFGARRPYRQPGFLDQLFGPGRGGAPQFEEDRPVDYSRAPPPKKSETTPTLSVIVMGDSLADWLGHGLEEALADSPEISVVRKIKTGSGLLRYEARNDLDWWHIARDNLANEKADFVVMMLGLHDRQAIRETQSERDKRTGKDKKEPAKEAAKQPADQAQKPEEKKSDDDEQPSIAAPEPPRGGVRGVTDFRTEKWEEIYSKRIDDTIAALKSKNVPVLWVGLPSIRGTRSTSEVVYLNDLFRARAEKAGIVFVDVWDGFVDETGKFSTHGPDFEGQIRRLRAGDGVHFTKNGARKLAHYVERELRRFMANRSMPVALPSGAPLTAPAGATPAGPTVRPVAGPVVPLTASPVANEELLGGATTRPVHGDPVATRVLVKGEPVAAPSGRADDFSWPRPGDPNAVEPLSPTAAAARAVPVAPAAKTPPSKREAAKPKAKEPDQKPKPPARANPQRAQPLAQQPQQQRPPSGPFGWLR